MRDGNEDVRNAGTFVALFGLVVIALGLLLFIGVVFPAVLFVVILVIFAPMVFAMHYLLWGWWMSVPPPTDEDEEG